jgi:hypothetical protein
MRVTSYVALARPFVRNADDMWRPEELVCSPNLLHGRESKTCRSIEKNRELNGLPPPGHCCGTAVTIEPDGSTSTPKR